MPYDPQHHYRHSIRLKGYDYTRTGAYYVTLVILGRLPLLGEVVAAEMRLNAAGRIAEACWRDLPAHFRQVALDAYVIMPNHVHGIVVISRDVGMTGILGEQGGGGDASRSAGGRGAACCAPTCAPSHATPDVTPGSLGAIVRSYKAAVTRIINVLDDNAGNRLWQRNYWEHVGRDEAEWARLRATIAANPARWEDDPENVSP
jgi:REP element-mobilizing transposase RayT